MNLTARESEILEILRRDPLIAPAEIARRLKSNRATIAVHLSSLARKGAILGRGYVLRDASYVAVIGGANIDIKTRIAGDTVMATSNPGQATVSVGGVARNIAHNLSKLGTAAKLVSVIGDDAEGKRLVEETAAAGVDVAAVIRGSGATGLYSAVLDRAGELVIGVAAMDLIEQLSVKALAQRQMLIDGAEMIVADCNLNDDCLAYIAERAAAKSIPLLIEPVSVKKAEKLARLLKHGAAIHAVTPNLKQMEVLAGRILRSSLDLRHAAEELHGKGVAHILLGLGAKGTLFSTRIDGKLEQREIPSAAADVRDVTGAGDSLVAGFVHALLRGDAGYDAAVFGQAAAGFTVGAAATVSEKLSEAAVTERAKVLRQRMGARV